MLRFSHILFRFLSLVLGLGDTGSFPPPLSAAEERALFEKMRSGSQAARDRIIEHNLRLVSHIIRKYYSSYPSPDDLLSIGSLGLIKAVDTFRYEVGARFATYGAKCVQNEILMFFRSQKKMGLEVSIHETIDTDRDGNPLTYLDIISVPDTITETVDLSVHLEKIRTLMNTALDEREREIIVLRYGLEGYAPRTQREVAAYLKISRSYVSRIEKKALEKLREGFGARPDFDN
ncbi:MAG: RNA polymerase sporulation sigma factor SigK [Clostridia bacterium]|nr:RNA polymerase sporulation sigma factor SigK [Clostridia bacterium]